MTCTTTRTERQARRADIRRRMLAEAEHDARLVGLSLACQVGNHPPSCIGATGCLCECHDPSEDS